MLFYTILSSIISLMILFLYGKEETISHKIKHIVFGINSIVYFFAFDCSNLTTLFFAIQTIIFVLSAYYHSINSHGIGEILSNLIVISWFNKISSAINPFSLIGLSKIFYLLPLIATLIGNGSRNLSPLYAGDALNILNEKRPKIYNLFNFWQDVVPITLTAIIFSISLTIMAYYDNIYIMILYVLMLAKDSIIPIAYVPNKDKNFIDRA